MWLIINRKNATIAPIKSILFDNTKELPIAGALWFLTALFWAETIYFLIMKFVKNNILQHIIVAAIALFGCFAAKILPFRLPWALDASFVGIGLMHIGSLIKNNMDNKFINALFNLKIPVWFVLAAGTVVLIFVNGYINMRLGKYAFVPLFWITLLLSVIVGINLSKYVNKLPIKKFNSALIYCGKNSIVFVCLNQFVILLVGRLINMIEGIPSRLAETIIFALSAAILYCLTYIITNTKLKALIGRF